MESTPTRLPSTPGRQQTDSSSQSSIDPLVVVQKHSVHTLVFRSLKRTHDLFLCDQNELPPIDPKANQLRMSIKAKDQFGPVLHLVTNNDINKGLNAKHNNKDNNIDDINGDSNQLDFNPNESSFVSNNQMTEYSKLPTSVTSTPSNALVLSSGTTVSRRSAPSMPRPEWHPPWKLSRVLSGHIGWVRALAVEPGNQWFASGSNDRIIKIWDLASGKLKLSLTGHISGVRGLAISARNPYLFSCGEDKCVKCWDLEYNKVVRQYHGHLSGVYSIALHPTIDILVSAGRDSVARVWDMRTKAQIHSLAGHTNTIASVQCQATEPQVITGSHDTTIKLWDIVSAKARVTLTHHKKSVRSVVIHPKLNMFASGSFNNLKQWRFPDGIFIQNLSGHNAIVNCMAVNSDGVLVSGGDNGSMFFWDWRTGYNFQRTQAAPQPGSIESECGIFALAFDQSSSRLITGEADKTIKIYKEDENASEETHPINWKPDIIKRRRY
jgi:pleiotropic regulator 1